VQAEHQQLSFDSKVTALYLALPVRCKVEMLHNACAISCECFVNVVEIFHVQS
jgi:hypothetical protein